ncbi:baculoviral IAP repeat-containing protein 5b [Vanacampus margaritifer]
MSSIEVIKNRFESYDTMYNHDSRVHTFANWPFQEGCNCTPDKMADAGLVHCPADNEPDVVCCFFCLLELEGWVPDDDPWHEHIKRSPTCAFLLLKKEFTELTVSELFHLEKERVKAFIKKVSSMKMAEFRDGLDKAQKSIQSKLHPD